MNLPDQPQREVQVSQTTPKAPIAESVCDLTAPPHVGHAISGPPCTATGFYFLLCHNM